MTMVVRKEVACGVTVLPAEESYDPCNQIDLWIDAVKFSCKLSSKERMVFALLLLGYKPASIAKGFGQSRAAVSKTLRRIKNKGSLFHTID